MAAQKGKDLLLKVDSTGGGAFVTVAGLRSHTISLNAEPVDITNADSSESWRELLVGGGVRKASISGSGIFKDEVSDATIRTYVFDGTIRDWQIIVPDFGEIEGAFQVTGLQYAGEHNGELAFELSLESAGALSFSAM